MADPRPIGVFDSGVGGLTVLREIVRRSPAESTIYLGDNARAPYGVRSDEEVLAFSTQCARRARRARRQGDRRRLQHLDRGRASARSGAATTCRSSASSGPGASAAALATRNRRVGVIATPATIRSHAYFDAIKDENPAVEVYEHATPTLVPLVEAGELRGPVAEAAVARGPRAAARRARRRRRVHLPAAARRADRHAAARLHALPAAAAAHRGARRASRSRSSTRRRRPRPRWPSCSTINGLEARDAAGRADRPGIRRRPRRHRPADDRRCRTLPRLAGRLFGVGVPGRRARSTSRWRPDDRPAGGRRRRPSWRDDRVWQAGLPPRLGARRRRDRRRPARRAVGAPRASSTGRRSSGSPSAGCAARPGALDARRARGRRAGLRRGDGADRAGALARALGTAAAGRRRALRRRRSGRLGPGQHRDRSRSLIGKLEADLLDQVVPPGGGLAKATMALANRWVDDPPARLPARVHGRRASSASTTSRCCPPRRRPAGCCSSRRTSARRPARWTCRSGRSGPGSPSTRRPTRSSSRRTPGSGRTSPSASSGSSRCSAATRAALGREALRGLGRALRGEARRRALDGAPDGPRAAAALPRDPGRDEPARGVQRLRHGRGRARPRARTSSGSARGSTSGATHRTAFERSMLRLTGHGPQARAVQEGRAVRPGHRRSPRPGGPRPALGRARRRCRATARSRRPALDRAGPRRGAG